MVNIIPISFLNRLEKCSEKHSGLHNDMVITMNEVMVISHNNGLCDKLMESLWFEQSDQILSLSIQII
jgi:hypothetical protein